MTKRPNGSTTVSLQEVSEHGDDGPSATPHHQPDDPWRDFRFGVSVLLVWWGVWTIADKTLIVFSPWSEIMAILLGAVLYLWECTRTIVTAQANVLKTSLMSIVNRI
eukprot:4808353-Prymnesium_polylepis.2